MPFEIQPDFDQQKFIKQIDSQHAGEDLSSAGRLRQRGYSEEAIQKVKGEKATEDAVPQDDGGLAGK